MITLVPAAFALSVAEVPNPRDRGSWVSDTAGVLSADAERDLDAKIDALKAKTGAELAVVTVREADRTPKAFATDLFARWGIGRAGADDGALFLLVTGARRLEVEVGYGLEGTLPDGKLGLMQQQRMVPRFRQGDYAGGLVAGVDWTIAQLEGEGEVPGATTQAAPVEASAWPFVAAGVPLAGTLMLAGVVVWARRQRRKCPNCGAETTVLDEEADDAHLTEGQRAEERVGSRNWVVRVCGGCGNVAVNADDAWFPGHDDCPSCGYRTLATTTTTLVASTHLSQGLARVDKRCQHCAYGLQFERVLPKRPPPVHHHHHRHGGPFGGGGFGGGGFGGGHSGGGFGGGHSGGGGAGSSW